MARRKPPTLSSELQTQQADYNGAKRSSRLQRKRRGIPAMGASGDYHYRSEADYLWMGELARDLDRNDVVIGQTIDRAVNNTLQGGFDPEPNTGDDGADQALKDRWAEESIDPLLCDVAGQLNFHEQTKMVLRDTLVAGDILPVPTEEGPIQLMEFHRCRSPRKTKKNIIHGVEMTAERERLRYWFTKEQIDPLSQQRVKVGDLRPIDAFDRNGNPNVWHVYFPKRVTQTRGVTALAPIFDVAGMHDDIQFAELLHRQVASCFFFFRNRTSEFEWAKQGQEQPIGEALPADGSTRRIEGAVPGMELTGGPGETLSMDSPNIPNSTFFPHVKMTLTFIGINLGMPLVMMLMDASETNFSGYRGAVDQARLGFLCNQQALVARWARPYWNWKVQRWTADDKSLQAIATKSDVNLLRHDWKLPAWPYIEPTKDAKADLMRLANMLTSPRRQAQERAMNYPTIVSETVADRKLAIETALVAAQELNKKYKLDADQAVRWRDLAPLPTPEGVNVSSSDDAEPTKAEGGRRKAEEA